MDTIEQATMKALKINLFQAVDTLCNRVNASRQTHMSVETYARDFRKIRARRSDITVKSIRSKFGRP